MDGSITRPTKPEHGNDQGKASYDAKFQTFLGLWRVWSNFLDVPLESGFDDSNEAVKVVLISGWVEEERERKKDRYIQEYTNATT